jgi:Leucine-rich repeat (LRR) protein
LALKSLILSGNQISGVGAASAADYLSENPFLEVLDISSNRITGLEIGTLLSSLAKNT